MQLLAGGRLSSLRAAAGLLVGVWALRLAEWVYSGPYRRRGGLQLNAVAIGFTVLVALATTLIVGIAPGRLRIAHATRGAPGACYVPARRAMRTDASVALRHE